MTHTYVPISQDRENRRARLRKVEAIMRERRVTQAGGVPCPMCGGAMADHAVIEDVCQCGTNWVGAELTARCYRNGAECPNGTTEESA